MSKLTVGNGEFLDSINNVELNHSFGNSLNSELQKIDNNFKKLVSVPFLKGEHGENIQLIVLPLFENDNLTKLGKAVVSCIYDENIDSLTEDIDDGIGGTLTSNGENYNSYGTLNNDTKIAFYGYVKRTPTSEKITITSQQIFIFIDGRISHIEDITEAQQNVFEDMSCALTISGEIPINTDTGEILVNSNDTIYNVVKHNIIPTLYYENQGINEWCWKINGAKSKISAQGLKGDNGENASCVVCYGIMQDQPDITNLNYPYVVYIQNILTSEGLVSPQTVDLHDGMLAVVWYEYNGKLNCTLGNVVVTENQPKIYVGHHPSNVSQHLNFDFLSAFNNVSLREQLNDICNTESNNEVNASEVSCRGLWINDIYSGSHTGNDNVHMLWSNNNVSNNKILHFGISTYNKTYGNETPDASKQWNEEQNPSKLEFHYDTIEKDYIRAKRKDTIDNDISYRKINITNIAGTNLPYIENDSSTINKNVNQAITISSNNHSYVRSQLSSNGLYLKGSQNDKIYSIELDSNKVVMDSEVSINDTGITITGDTEPSYNLSSLLDSDNLSNLENDLKIHINKQNAVLTNANLLIGGSKVNDSLNAYTQHYKNHSIYNFDSDSIIQSNIGSSHSLFWNVNRPRELELIPLRIGGLLSLYTTDFTNTGINWYGSHPNYHYGIDEHYTSLAQKVLKLSPEDNFKQTFMSGKFGWVNNVFASNIGIVTSDTIKQFTSISDSAITPINTLPTTNPNKPTTDPYIYGLSTSTTGMWTKIGNVVNVNGKIFFFGVKGESNSIDFDKYPITYAALYDFMMKNGDSISFPLPVILETQNSETSEDRNTLYTSTGEIYYNNHLNSINSGTGIDLHWNEDEFGDYKNNGYRSEIVSKEVDINDILNGSLTFHFFGNTKQNHPWPVRNESSENDNVENYIHFGDGAIESLPNIFACNANIKLNPNKRSWSIFAIPDKELLNTNNGGITSDITGPVRIANDLKYESSGVHTLPQGEFTKAMVHQANIVDFDVEAINHTADYNQSCTRKVFNITTTISPYIVRYATFQFSYLLDDDVNSYDKAYNKNGKTIGIDSDYQLTNIDFGASNVSINNTSTNTSTNTNDNQGGDDNQGNDDNQGGNENSGGSEANIDPNFNNDNGDTEAPSENPTVKP